MMLTQFGYSLHEREKKKKIGIKTGGRESNNVKKRPEKKRIPKKL